MKRGDLLGHQVRSAGIKNKGRGKRKSGRMQNSEAAQSPDGGSLGVMFPGSRVGLRLLGPAEGGGWVGEWAAVGLHR